MQRNKQLKQTRKTQALAVSQNHQVQNEKNEVGNSFEIPKSQSVLSHNRWTQQNQLGYIVSLQKLKFLFDKKSVSRAQLFKIMAEFITQNTDHKKTFESVKAYHRKLMIKYRSLSSVIKNIRASLKKQYKFYEIKNQQLERQIMQNHMIKKFMDRRKDQIENQKILEGDISQTEHIKITTHPQLFNILKKFVQKHRIKFYDQASQICDYRKDQNKLFQKLIPMQIKGNIEVVITQDSKEPCDLQTQDTLHEVKYFVGKEQQLIVKSSLYDEYEDRKNKWKQMKKDLIEFSVILDLPIQINFGNQTQQKTQIVSDKN